MQIGPWKLNREEEKKDKRQKPENPKGYDGKSRV